MDSFPLFRVSFSIDVTRAIRNRDVDKRDLRGISPQYHKYIFSVAGGAAVGAGLGYILPGEKTPLKLMMIGSGGASTGFCTRIVPLLAHSATGA